MSFKLCWSLLIWYTVPVGEGMCWNRWRKRAAINIRKWNGWRMGRGAEQASSWAVKRTGSHQIFICNSGFLNSHISHDMKNIFISVSDIRTVMRHIGNIRNFHVMIYFQSLPRVPVWQPLVSETVHSHEFIAISYAPWLFCSSAFSLQLEEWNLLRHKSQTVKKIIRQDHIAHSSSYNNLPKVSSYINFCNFWLRF